MNENKKTHSPAYLAWVVWGAGAALFFLSFFQRVAPAVMTDRLMADFNIGAAALGNLSAFYFYSYVAMQIPTGIIADRWGPRKLLLVGSFVAALGTFLFAWAPSLLFANLGRLLLGGAGGVAFVSCVKLATRWFDPRRFSTMPGLTVVCGTAGAVMAGVPLRILLDHFGWRPVMFISALLTLALVFVIWYIVHDDPSDSGYVSYHTPKVDVKDISLTEHLANFRSIFRYRNTWLLSIIPGGLLGPILAFTGLWGVPFLNAGYGLSHAQSAAIASFLMVMFSVGGALMGGFSEKVGRRKPLYLAGCIVAIVGWALIVYIPGMPIWLLVSIIAIVGFASSSLMIGFAFAKESVPPSMSGSVTGVCNTGNMVGPMALIPIIGLILEQHWNGAMANGSRIYDMAAYQSAFVWMIAGLILAAVLIMLTKETNCRQLVEERS